MMLSDMHTSLPSRAVDPPLSRAVEYSINIQYEFTDPLVDCP
jgi:hypothetical protein